MVSSAVMAQPSSAPVTQSTAVSPQRLTELIPDRTPQSDLNTQIQAVPDQQRWLITGGTDAANGHQRFHSFEKFNIAPGQAVYFQASPQLKTILSRVTGPSPSEILGRLGVVGGNADLFLLNPNGIYFGPEAKLDLRGSFFASTADTVTWPSFNADSSGDSSSSQLTTSPLLSLGITPGLQLGQLQGDVRNQAELSVAPGQSITLLGKAVEHRGGLVASGGAVRLLGDRVLLLDQAQIDVSATDGGGRVWIGGDRQGQGQLPLASQTGIAPEVQIRADAITQGPGGEVIVWADGQTQFYGQISAQGGPQGGDGGFVEVSGKKALQFEGNVNTDAPLGAIGTLLLDPTNIEVVPFFTFTNRFDVNEFSDPDQQNQTTQISASIINDATSNILLQATDTIAFNTDKVEISRPGVGLTAQAGEQIIVNGSITTGAGGDLRLIAGDRSNGVVPGQGNILVTSALERSFLRADGGNLVLQAGNTIEMNDAQAQTFAFRSNNGGADSGQLSIEAQTLRMNSSVLVSSSPLSQQVSGVEIRVQNADLSAGAIESIAFNDRVAQAGAIAIDAGTLSLSDKFAIVANSQAEVPAGSVSIQADQVNLSGASRILAQTSQQGNAGTIEITTGSLKLDGNSQLSVGSFAEQQGGDAGLIGLQVSETATLDNSTIDADAISGNSGSVDFSGDNLVLTQGSLLSNLALGEGTAGDLKITANSLLLDQSQILSLTLGAASDRGNGQIDVRTTGDITLQNGAAIFNSTAGQGNSGRLVINSGGAIQLSNRNYSG